MITETHKNNSDVVERLRIIASKASVIVGDIASTSVQVICINNTIDVLYYISTPDVIESFDSVEELEEFVNSKNILNGRR